MSKLSTEEMIALIDRFGYHKALPLIMQIQFEEKIMAEMTG